MPWWNGPCPGNPLIETKGADEADIDGLLNEFSYCCSSDLVYVDQSYVYFDSCSVESRLSENDLNNRTRGTILSCKPMFRMYNTDVPIVKESLLFNGFSPTSSSGWSLLWSGCHLKDEHFYGLADWQKLNHFPGTDEITRKDRLWIHFLEARHRFGFSHFDFVPETFVLPRDLDIFLETFDKRPECLWICKPNALSRGRGIFLLRKLKQLELTTNSTLVVSRYVDNPMLIQGLKYDLRIYVLVTSYDPLLFYVYREGLTRFASSPFSVRTAGDLSDKFKHLTNYSVNKSSNAYVENKDIREDNMGHKWSLSALNKHLKCLGVDVSLVWERIIEVISKTILMSQRHVDCRLAKSHAFELFGFDILLDSKLKPWLLEVNLSPSLATESPLDKKVKKTMISDILNLVGIETSLSGRLRREKLFSSTMRSTTSAADSGWTQNRNIGDERSRKLIFSALAEIKRAKERNSNFLRIFPTGDSLRKYFPVFYKSQDFFRNTQLLCHILYPSVMTNFPQVSLLSPHIVFAPKQRRANKRENTLNLVVRRRGTSLATRTTRTSNAHGNLLSRKMISTAGEDETLKDEEEIQGERNGLRTSPQFLFEIDDFEL